MYDLIVIGAGPSGSMLAYQCANLGYQVLILEKNQFPRPKTCGGGLTYKALRNLPFDIHPVVEVEAVGGIVSYQGRKLLQTNQVEQPFAWLVKRPFFDQFLIERAIEAGAVFAQGEALSTLSVDDNQVKVKTDRAVYCCRILAGADGVHSTVARLCNLVPNRRVGLAIETEIEVPPSIIDAQGAYATFDFGALPGGYGWIFPKKDQLSIGIFCSQGKAKHLNQKLESFMALQPILQGFKPTRPHAHPIPLGGQKQDLHKGRILLVGDAANLSDPWLGEGIFTALSSALIAAGVIHTSLTQETQNLALYTRVVNRDIVSQLHYAQRFANLVYRFPYAGSILLSKSKRMQQLVFGVMRGNITFKQLYQRLITSLPAILIESLTN